MGSNKIAGLGRAHALSIIGLGRSIELVVNRTGLTATRFRALSLIATGQTSGTVLAKFLAVQPPTVTAVMNGLVEDGLVDRVRSETDRRRVDYELTAAGEAALDEAYDAVDTRLEAIVGHLPDAEDRSGAVRGLDLWREALDTWRGAT